MVLLVSVMLVLWKLKVQLGNWGEGEYPCWGQPPSMAPSHVEVKAGTWEEWPLIPSLPPSRAQTEATTFHGEKKNTYFRKQNNTWLEETIST